MEMDIDEANAILESKAELSAKWWYYSVGHQTFEIVIGDPLGPGNIVLCLDGCMYLKGPVQWENQRIRVMPFQQIIRGKMRLRNALVDESVGFRVEGANFFWRQDFNIVARRSIYNPNDV